MCDTIEVVANNFKDRISNLPEIATSHILSRLPTKEAVQTCVLSKDWKYKWTSINTVHIVDSGARKVSMENEATFFNFMEKMSLLSLSHNVRSFYLKCRGYYDADSMSAWISAVLGPKLEEFTLIFGWEGLVLPNGLLNCNSLKTLHLHSQITFKVPAVHTFPNLVDMHLDGIDILNEDSVTFTITLKFPVLKVLKMRRCKWLNVKIVEIHAPELTELSSETDFRAGESNYSIQVIGARLSKFSTRLGLHDNLVFTGSKVDFAALDSATGYAIGSKLYQEFASQVRRLLNEVWSINYLKISSNTAEAIAQPNPKIYLRRYDKLERLDIRYDVARQNVLWELLNAAPNLKILHVETCSFIDRNHVHDVVGFVPSCTVSSLEEFKIMIEPGARNSEFDLVKFLMENGKKLKKVYLLFCRRGPDACDFLERLSRVAKASTDLQVVVDYKKYTDLNKLLADV